MSGRRGLGPIASLPEPVLSVKALCWAQARPSTEMVSYMDEGKILVCLCHDVTEYDLVAAYRAGYTHPETLKRVTGCFMGPCQGRHCSSAFLAVYRQLSGAEGIRPSARPPLGMVRLGQLAGGFDGPTDGGSTTCERG